MIHPLPILEALEISKDLPGKNNQIPLLENISLTVYPGESIAIVGKSGSGKSSLLHILGTLDNPTKGKVSFPIHPNKSLEQLRQSHIGFVFQSFHLLEDYSLLDNILMPGKIAKKPLSLLKPRALGLLEEVGLMEKQTTPVKFLSGGEKQRAAIARAFCNDPDILLVDEPTGNLDPVNALTVQNLLLQSCKKHKKALILVTHDPEFAACCDRIYFLKEGKLQ